MVTEGPKRGWRDRAMDFMVPFTPAELRLCRARVHDLGEHSFGEIRIFGTKYDQLPW